MHGTHIEDLTDRIKPRTASNVLLWVITGFVVVFFIWASLAKIERTVRGMGRVIPSSQLQVVSNLEGGIVSDILVRQGQDVRAGAPLIRLDPTQSGAEFGSGEATLSALMVKIARLTAELEGRTLVLITHRPPLLQLVQRIILIDKGRVIADGPRDAVLKQITRPQGQPEQ